MSIATKLSEVKIRRLPLRRPAMVERSASIRETVEAMKASRLGCALVCERGKLVGLFDQVMTFAPAHLSLDDSVYSAMRLMREGDYRNVPLVDAQGAAAGVVTVRDLVSYFAEHFPKEALNLPPDHAQLMLSAEGA
jgi:CBS domain-containing protein